MFIVVLGIIDIVSAIIVFLSIGKITALSGIGLFLSIILILKFLISIAPHEKSLFGGIIDIIGAVIILLSSGGIYIHYIIPLVVGFFLFLKGVQSVIPEVIG